MSVRSQKNTYLPQNRLYEDQQVVFSFYSPVWVVLHKFVTCVNSMSK